MNKRRNIYRGFNKRRKGIIIRNTVIGISVLVIGGYAYVGISNSKIVDTLYDKFTSLDFFSSDKAPAIDYKDVEKELAELDKDEDKESENSTETEVAKTARTDGWSIYTIQVASMTDDKEVEKIQETLNEAEIPFSIIDMDGQKKVQTYSSFSEESVRGKLDSVRTEFPDAFLSEVKMPLLYLEYTEKYSYMDTISKSLNDLVENFKEESAFWENNTDTFDEDKFNEILGNRKAIVEGIGKEVEKIDYSETNVFKDSLVKYTDDLLNKIELSLKAVGEKDYNTSESLFIASMQGYFTFINSIKEA